MAFVYDKVSDNTASSEPKPSKFQSGHKVVKKGSKHLTFCVCDIQSDVMHRNYPKHTLFENHWFRYIIWAPDLRNHQKLTDSSRFVIKRTECAAKCLIIGICSSLVIFRYLMFLTWVISVTSTSQFYCRGESFTNKSELVHHTVYRSNGSAFSHLLTDRAEGVDPSFPTLRSAWP